ncbi:MAG: 2-oxo acid dehydrogenase subunit E2 [Pseudomonadota bacterium]
MNAAAITPVFVERQNVNDESVVVLQIHVQSGQCVSADDVVVEIETSKTNIEITSPVDGFVVMEVGVDEEVEIGALLFNVHAADPAQQQDHAVSTDISSQEAADQDHAIQVSSKTLSKAASVRMAELGVSNDQLPEHSWITVADVEAAAGLRPADTSFAMPDRPSASSKQAARSDESSTPKPVEPASPVDLQRKSKRKQAEAGNLTVFGNVLPQSTIWSTIHIENKRVVNPPFLFEQSIADLIVYEGAKLLQKYPALNACHIDDKNLGVYQQINFGISFDSGENLKVLAIEDADQLSLTEIQAKIEELLQLYESGKPIDQKILTGSTVTLSDLSQTGASSMLPLINGTQSLILGLSQTTPGCFEVAASFDHRVTEGLVVTQFLEALSERVVSYYFDDQGIVNTHCSVCARSMAEEVALGNRGMIKIQAANGKDQLVCRNCFDGW